MFEHLDDPAPFWPDAELRSAAVKTGRRLRLRRRVAAVTAGLTLTVIPVGVAGALYVERRDNAIDRVDIATPTGEDGSLNILLVGVDHRPEGFDDSDLQGSRADTMALVRINTDGTVGVLGIPRDLRDPASGQRINGFADDPQALVDTIHKTLGVPIDHFVEIDLAGFIDMVDAVGGLDIAVDVPLRDDHSGLDLQPSPCTTLDGETALALVRARHVEGDDGNDFSRIARGHAVLTAGLAAVADGGNDLLTVDRLSRVLADHALLDDDLSLGRLTEIGRMVAAAGPAGLLPTTLPVAELNDPANGAMMLVLTPEAAPVLQQFGAPDTTIAPTEGAGPPVQAPRADSVGLHPCAGDG
jgi:LCP family protein required for cell wall assembly